MPGGDRNQKEEPEQKLPEAENDVQSTQDVEDDMSDPVSYTHLILVSDPDLSTLPLPEKAQLEHKYNEYIPQELLRKQFLFDFLDPAGLKSDMQEPNSLDFNC